MEVNIEYPMFESAETGVQFNKINSFYKRIGETYLRYCNIKAQKIINKSEADNIPEPYGEVFKHFVTYADNSYLSVVCEITHFDGKFKDTAKISQTWYVKKQIMLGSKHFIRSLGETKSSVKRKIKEIIINDIKSEEGNFSYTRDSVKKYAGNINTDNYFLCEKGIGFWFDKGTLAPENEGFPTFILPLKKEQSCH